MLDVVDPLMEIWMSDYWGNKAFLDRIRDEYGPLAMEIADDSDGSRSFWKQWSVLMTNEFKPFYRFLDENGFSWPPGGFTFEFIDHKENEVPYVRID